MEEKPIRCPICRRLVPRGYIMCPYCGTDLRLIIRMRLRLKLKMRDIVKRLHDVIIKPRNTMKEIVAVPDYLGPGICVMMLAFFISLRNIIAMASYGFPVSIYVLIAIFFVWLLLGILMWFLIVAIINWIFKLVGGTQSFEQTATAFGYSLLPTVFGVILGTIIFSVNPTEELTVALIMIPFLIWSLILCSIGLYYSSNLPKHTCVFASILAYSIPMLFFFVIS